MGRKPKVLFEEKLKAIEDYFSGKRRAQQICLELQIHQRSFYDWLRKYQLQGKQGLQAQSSNKYYPEQSNYRQLQTIIKA